VLLPSAIQLGHDYPPGKSYRHTGNSVTRDAAFRDAPHSDGHEANIVDALRIGGVLTVSLVAEDEDKIVGHVAFSPVAVNSQEFNWFGLGPVAVLTEKRRCGIGAALIEAGLKCLKELGARGCVVLGDPVYYRRFGLSAILGFVSPTCLQSIFNVWSSTASRRKAW
jgi:putative acetyltransferase